MNGSLQRLVLLQLGFESRPRVNLDGLRAVYRAWCASVPFDNVRKMIALRSNPRNPLPGGDADSFFEAWLTHSAGGTCWPTSNALFELLDSLGFAAFRIALRPTSPRRSLANRRLSAGWTGRDRFPGRSARPFRLSRFGNMRHKRVIVARYGGPEVIAVVEEDVPAPKARDRGRPLSR